MTNKKLSLAIIVITAAYATVAFTTNLINPTNVKAVSNYPSQVFSLKNWIVQLPIADPKGKSSVKTIFQPQLDTYTDEYFKLNDSGDAILFKAHTGGKTTSSNTDYARSELREMTADGSQKIGWASSGYHSMVIDQAITHLPDKKPHVVVGQIHAKNGDPLDDIYVFRAEKDLNTGKIKLFGKYVYPNNPSKNATISFTDDYKLGDRFTAKFEVEDGEIRSYYAPYGQPLTLKHTIKGFSFNGAYFKAGIYVQSSCTKNTGKYANESCDAYGEVAIYNVKVCHDANKCGITTFTENQAPVAVIKTNKTNAKLGENITFDASSSTDSDGTIVSYKWKFGETDDHSLDSKTKVYSFNKAGTQSVALTVTDDKGATKTTETTVTVEDSTNNNEIINYTAFSNKDSSIKITFSINQDLATKADEFIVYAASEKELFKQKKIFDAKRTQYTYTKSIDRFKSKKIYKLYVIAFDKNNTELARTQTIEVMAK